MLPNLASLFQYIDVLFTELRVRIGRVVGLNKLRKPQRASHPRWSAADNDDIRRHLRPFHAFNWSSEDDHFSFQFPVSSFVFPAMGTRMRIDSIRPFNSLPTSNDRC